MAHNNWEADKMLDVYIYDYLIKRNLLATAKVFKAEAKVSSDPVAIDAPGGFLFEWWFVFWDIFIARTNEKHSEPAAAYIELQQLKARELQQQQLQMQQLQFARQTLQQRRDPSLSSPVNPINSDVILPTSSTSVLASKMYGEHLKNPNLVESDVSQQLLDPCRIALIKSATNNSGQLVQGSVGGVSASLQQIHARTQQSVDIKGEIGVSQRPLPMDPSSIYGHGIMQPKAGLAGGALSQSVSGLPLNGWPLTTGVDPLRLSPQVQKSISTTQSQYLMSQQHQIVQAQAGGNIGNLTNYVDIDPRRVRALSRSNMSGKDGQTPGNDGSIGPPIQLNSPKVIRQDQAEYLMKLKASQSQQSAQMSHEQLQQPQLLQQNNKRRKSTSSSGPVNSAGTGNTAGPSSNSPPSTPSTHTPGDGATMAGNLPHVSSMPKCIMMYESDGTGGLATNQMDDVEHFGDVTSLAENVDSYLSPDDGDGRDVYGALKGDHSTDTTKGITFNEVGCIRTSNSKVLCCHFSSDGKLLASAGHEKKAVLWNMDTLQTESTPEEHGGIITDIRFRPNSTRLATASFDGTVRLWNAADTKYCLNAYVGHNSEVTSLDFHPKKTDLLCSCDSSGEIRFWNVNQISCSRVSKGGTAQVRFQPTGHLLAAAAENVVSILDSETDRKIHSLQGHTKEIFSVCWNASGDCLASVSQDCVKVWSLKTGKLVHELSSNGNKFNSCIFHPSYSDVLVVGGYQSLELWSALDNRTMMVQAHDGLIADLAESPVTGMVASASHDKSVKLWK